MGIVSFCPNGHRTKLKDHYAGRRVYCPHCGTKFRVDNAGTASPPAEIMPEFESPFATTAASLAPRATETPKASTGKQSIPRTTESAIPVATDSTSATTDCGDSHLPAAIAEAVDGCWCIAIPGGEPSPPMSASEMHTWLMAARATGNEVVWRTGWPDWQPIKTTFPEFFDRS